MFHKQWGGPAEHTLLCKLFRYQMWAVVWAHPVTEAQARIWRTAKWTHKGWPFMTTEGNTELGTIDQIKVAGSIYLLVFAGRNKEPQTEWLKTTEMFSLTVPDSRRRVLAGPWSLRATIPSNPLRFLDEEPFLEYFMVFLWGGGRRLSNPVFLES